MISAVLEKTGFTKGEIRVYLALLELGNTTSGPLILRSKVSRSKVYEIVERLKVRGIVTESIKEHTKYFQATSPDKILSFLHEKQSELQRIKQEFTKILPELKRKHKPVEEQAAKVYEGFEGVKTFYGEILGILRKNDTYYAMTFSDKALEHESIIHLFQWFHHQRSQKGIRAKVLCHESDKQIQTYMNFKHTGLYEFKITNQRLPTGIAIVKNIVATFNWGKNPKVFVIISKSNANYYQQFFDDVWKQARPI